MKTYIVGPPGWRSIVADALLEEHRPANGSSLAYAALRALHSRGCGVPPRLCVSFSNWVAGSDAGPWPEVVSSLLAGLLGGVPAKLRELAPERLLRTLFAPMAYASLGRKKLRVNVVFGGEGYPGRVEESFDYNAYGDDFIQAALGLADAKRQLRLSRTSRGPGPVDVETCWLATWQSLKTSSLPIRLDAQGLELFASAPEPAIAELERVRNAGPPARTSLHRGDIRPQQDGITGHRKTTSFEELAAMDVGFLIGPKPLVAQRLFEEGFVVFDRPPPQDKPEAILLIALAPEATESVALSVARAAWWLAALHAVQRLRDRRFERVDVVWTQSAHGRTCGGARLALEPTPAEGKGSAFSTPELSRVRLLEMVTRDPVLSPFRRGRTPIGGSPHSPAQDVSSGLEALLPAEGDQVALGVDRAAWIDVAAYETVYVLGLSPECFDAPIESGDLRDELEARSSGLYGAGMVRYGRSQSGDWGLRLFEQDRTQDFRLSASDAIEEARRQTAALAGAICADCLARLDR